MTCPCTEEIPPEDELIIQKSFLDAIWSISMSDMVLRIEKRKIQFPSFDNWANKLNKGKFTHAREHKSFKQLFLAEIAGGLDYYGGELKEAIAYLFEKQTGQKPSAEEMAKCNSASALIYEAVNQDKIGDFLPSLVIPAGLHASIRQDVNRKFKPHDAMDIRHAEAALPYFDYFFTERSLKDLELIN